MKALPLEKMPFSLASFNEECRELSREQRAIVLELRSYIWRLGFLPIAPRDVAEKVGLSERRWIRIAPAISMHFDHDEDGRWRDLDLEEARDRHLDARQKMSAGGTAGIQKRWADVRAAKEAEHAAERQARAEAHAREAEELPEGFASMLGDAKGTDRVEALHPIGPLSGIGANPYPDPIGSGVASGGLTDSSNLNSDDGSSVSRSIEPPSCVGAEASAADALGAHDGLSGASLSDREEASDRVPRSNPIGPLSRSSPAEASTTDSLSNDELAQLVIAAGGEGLATNWPRRQTFKVVRAAMAMGLDFRLDYLPEVRAFADGARKGARGSLQVPANTEIMAAAFARRDRRLKLPDRVDAYAVDPCSGAERPIDGWIDPPAPPGRRLGGNGGKRSAIMESYREVAEMLEIGK